MLTSSDEIHIADKVYNSDRQLSIMQSLSFTTTAATAVQNPSMGELHAVRTRYNKQGAVTKDRNSGHPGQHSNKLCH